MTATTSVSVQPARRMAGRISVPGDKSISHRALLLSAVADGTSRLDNLGPGDDCRTTRDCLRALGVDIRDDPAAPNRVVVAGRGLGGLQAPRAELDAGNSGTTTRLLLGLLAGHDWDARVTGDASLRRRPMRRILDPLERMGARVRSEDGRLPVGIRGGGLRAIDYRVPVASAQVKSGIMLAALHARGITIVREPTRTRDHTERAFARFGVPVAEGDDGEIRVEGGRRLTAADVVVPGDPSSAAFWAVAAAALPGSDIAIEGVGLNPTRLGFVDVLRRAGAVIDVDTWPGSPASEPVGVLRVRHGTLEQVIIAPEEVPSVIDELPALAALATFGGSITVNGAGELRVKESDRIADLVRGFRLLGATAEEWEDGFAITARRRLTGGVADAAGDHRLAMAFALAALGAEHESRIEGSAAVSVSYPGFFQVLEGLRG